MEEVKNKTVAEILSDLKQSNLVDLMPPEVLSSHLLVLSAFITDAGYNITEAEIAHAKKWTTLRGSCETVAETNVAIKLEPEYKTLRGAEFAEKSLIENIRSIKHVLKVKTEEAHNQY